MFKYTVEGKRILAINALELERSTLIKKWLSEDEEIKNTYELLDYLFTDPKEHQEQYLELTMNCYNIKEERQQIIKEWNEKISYLH